MFNIENITSHNENVEEGENSHYTNESNEDLMTDDGQTDPQWEAAIFLMKATNELTLTHAGIERLCMSTKWLVNKTSENIGNNLKESLKDLNMLTPEMKIMIERACSSTSDTIFNGLEERSYRESYHLKHFNYVVNNYYYNYEPLSN